MLDPIIEVKNIVVRRGDRQILNGVSFDVGHGEFFSILGPSGCGKTTLLRLLAGLDTPDSGDILVEGKPIANLSNKAQKILMVFQNFALFPHMTVFQNIAFGLKLKGLRAPEISDRVSYYLDLVKLPGFGERFPSQLSGGQQQRVAIARALAPEPAAVLFDEPLGALDQKLRREMQFELKNIQERLKTTFIYVTHDQEEALTLSDRIALMDNGAVVQIGTPSALYRKPESEFCAKFIGDNNAIQGVVKKCLGKSEYLISVGSKFDVEVPSLSALSVGQRVVMFVRPEHLNISHLLPSNEHLSNHSHVTCGLTQELYVGRERLLNLNLDGQKLVAKVDAEKTFENSNDLHCYWNKNHAHVFLSKDHLNG